MVHDNVRKAYEEMVAAGEKSTEIAGHIYSQKDLKEAIDKSDREKEEKSKKGDK